MKQTFNDTPIFREMVKENKYDLDFREVSPGKWVLNRNDKKDKSNGKS